MRKKIKKIALTLVVLLLGVNGYAQKKDTLDNGQYQEFLKVVNNAVNSYYDDFPSTKEETDSIISTFGYKTEYVPEFSDSVIRSRLMEMNKMSPIHFDTNQIALNVIKYFSHHRRRFTSIILGRSKLYFPMIEAKLDQHNMPLELKYLAVIESGLRPGVRSHAGAQGLWQFMYRTGKMCGLHVNSYIDQRMDPEAATEAACFYLQKLYNLYGDWYMALAAYNCGPGNLNKAIRRSGGEMTYWGVRPYLPRETRGYVPNFIAMAYLMTYYPEHNIHEREPKYKYFQVDTVCLRKGLNMAPIDSVIGWKVEDIKALNPVYKTEYMPSTPYHKCINIPDAYIGKWITMEDSIYALDSILHHRVMEKKEKKEKKSEVLVHRVRRGENLSYIASRFGTSVREIMHWNNLRSTRLAIGQRLKIYTNGGGRNVSNSSAQGEDDLADSSEKGVVHTIQKGESLWVIANRSDTTVKALLRLNPGINYRDLKVGQEIRIR